MKYTVRPNPESLQGGFRPDRAPLPPPPVGEVVHVRHYSPPNWFTPVGVAKKRKAIEAKGLPGFERWRFITLTFARESSEDFPVVFAGPLEAFLWGRKFLRVYMMRCRQAGLWADDARWCWKLEFQRDGWPHWHLLVDRLTPFSRAEMDASARIWGKGRVNHEMVSDSDFLYSFKYAFKGVLQNEPGDCHDFDDVGFSAPAWFLDYVGSKRVTVNWVDADGLPRREQAEKPVTMARVRFWQTSTNFYVNAKPPVSTCVGNPSKSQVPLSVREISDVLGHSVQVLARDRSGNYRRSAIVALLVTAGALCVQASWHVLHGAGTFFAINSYTVPVHVLSRAVDPVAGFRVRSLISDNSLSLRRALAMAALGQTLSRC